MPGESFILFGNSLDSTKPTWPTFLLPRRLSLSELKNRTGKLGCPASDHEAGKGTWTRRLGRFSVWTYLTWFCQSWVLLGVMDTTGIHGYCRDPWVLQGVTGTTGLSEGWPWAKSGDVRPQARASWAKIIVRRGQLSSRSHRVSLMAPTKGPKSRKN